jgi:carbonic anhydrase/acetyltransferase-like protein (isoleucine patch superfamily)
MGNIYIIWNGLLVGHYKVGCRVGLFFVASLRGEGSSIRIRYRREA